MERITLLQYLTALQGTLRAIVALCALILIILCTNRQSHIPASKHFLFFVIAMGLWGFFGSIFFIYPEDNHLPDIGAFIYAAMSFSGPAFMRFCFSYVFPHKKPLIKSLQWIFVFPCIFSLFVLLPPLQKYAITFTNVVIYIPYRDILEQYNFLYYVYIVYSYGTALLGCTILLYKVIKQPRESTIGSKLAILAALLFIGQNMFVSLNEHNKLFFWVPPIIVTICMVLLFFTLYYDTSEQIIIQGQSALLENIPFPVFILNKNDIIIHFNKTGKEFISSIRNEESYLFKKKDLLRQFTIFEIEPSQQKSHDKGNEYITLCHDIIRSSVHADDFIFRLGDDEFLVIMSNTEQRIVQERVLTIEAKMQEIKKEYNTSISLGSATAEEIPIDYLQLISDDDEDMYRKKCQRKPSLPTE
jgi:hypothetical protein